MFAALLTRLLAHLLTVSHLEVPYSRLTLALPRVYNESKNYSFALLAKYNSPYFLSTWDLKNIVSGGLKIKVQLCQKSTPWD